MSNVDEKFGELVREVDAAGGLKVFKMEGLRDAYDAGRLGTHVVRGISEKLREHGMGHIPAVLPSSQWDEVRLYSLRKEAGKVIEAVLHPTADGDKLILEVASGEAREIMQKVRELVCD